MDISPRMLSDAERTLVLALLEFGGHARAPYTALDSLRVVALCDCGCQSFETRPEGAPPRASGSGFGRILADAYGAVEGGNAVGLILWGDDAAVTYTEIYSLAYFSPYAELPRPDSVAAVPAGWDSAG